MPPALDAEFASRRSSPAHDRHFGHRNQYSNGRARLREHDTETIRAPTACIGPGVLPMQDSSAARFVTSLSNMDTPLLGHHGL
jgi:hypothetical protein